MMTPHRPAHLSPSRLSTYDRCPVLYWQRYIEKIDQPPSFERAFGTAVHAGLEAHYRGLDYEMAYLLSWRTAQKLCRASSVQVPAWLTNRGLELIDMVRRLGLDGVPEQRIGLITADIGVPIIGYIDLETDGTVYDFKTAGWPWTQDRADREMFQPVMYSQAYAESHEGVYPTFTFIVLSRNGGSLQQLDGTRTTRQIFKTFERAREIYRAIENQEFACTCKGRYCGTAREAA